jgi:hypothetical protein
VTFHVKAGDADVTLERPVQFRYVKDIYSGDKRMELNVVPDFSVSVSPALAQPMSGSGSRGVAGSYSSIHLPVFASPDCIAVFAGR